MNLNLAEKSKNLGQPITPTTFASGHAVLTLPQLSDVYNTVDQILDLLDEPAILELTQGGQKDIDQVIDLLVDETAAVLTDPYHLVDQQQFGFIDRFGESLEMTLRFRSLNYFILSCLPNFILGWHNIEWGNLVQLYQFLNILAARDHSKSYEFSFAYPLWQMYRYQSVISKTSKIPYELKMAKEGLLITNEKGLAKHFLAMIKEEVENNPILQERLMPENKREGWGKETIVTKNGAKLSVKSAGSKIRGYHPTYIILDDFLNESSLYSQDQRDKYFNKFSGVIHPALEPGGQMVIVGTPFHDQDLYHVLKKGDQFKVFEYPAIFPDGTLLFPQRHKYKQLMGKQKVLGKLIFSREILVKPITDAAAIFPYEGCLNNSIKGMNEMDVVTSRDNTKRKFVKIAVGCDFAISSSIGADYSVFTIGGLDELGYVHILNCWRKRGANYRQQIAALRKINTDFKPDIMYAEDNGMQEIFIQMMKDANLPVVGKTTTATNKKSLYKGIPSLAVHFENHRIKFPYGSEKARALTDLYHGELNSITYIQDTGKLESTTQHDDCAASLWLLFRALKGDNETFDFSFLNNG